MVTFSKQNPSVGLAKPLATSTLLFPKTSFKMNSNSKNDFLKNPLCPLFTVSPRNHFHINYLLYNYIYPCCLPHWHLPQTFQPRQRDRSRKRTRSSYHAASGGPGCWRSRSCTSSKAWTWTRAVLGTYFFASPLPGMQEVMWND